MKFKMLVFFFWFILFILSYHSGFTSHIRAGEIVVKQSSCQDGIFSITLVMYGDTGSPIHPGDGLLNFGDGFTTIVPGGNFVPRADLSPTVGVFVYSIDHKFVQQGIYTISYSEANRNSGILNIQNSSGTPFLLNRILHSIKRYVINIRSY